MIAKIRQPREVLREWGSICSEEIDYVPGAEGAWQVLYSSLSGSRREHLDAWHDRGLWLPASDVSQQVGATSRSWRPGSKESNIDFQNLPVTGLAACPSRSAGLFGVSSMKDLLSTSHRSVSPRLCGSTRSMIFCNHLFDHVHGVPKHQSHQ